MSLVIASLVLPAIYGWASTPAEPPAGVAVSARVESWLTLLRRAEPDRPAVIEAATALIKEGIAKGKVQTDHDPEFLVVTCHLQGTRLRDLTVHVYDQAPSTEAGILNPQGYVRRTVGDEFFRPLNDLVGLMFQQGTYLGDEKEVQRQQRAITLSLQGDVTLLREETVEPLHIVAIMPVASRYLPGSLRARVRCAFLNADLNFLNWHGTLGMFAGDAESAELVGNTVSAWREMAASLAELHAGTEAAKPLRDAVRDIAVEVDGTLVTATTTMPANMIARAAGQLAGHGGGCTAGAPCSSTQYAICNGGKTKCVDSTYVLGSGDVCGPCSPLLCPKGTPCAATMVPMCKNNYTVCVASNSVASYLAQGYACGQCTVLCPSGAPCPAGNTLMCYKAGANDAQGKCYKDADVAKQLAAGIPCGQCTTCPTGYRIECCGGINKCTNKTTPDSGCSFTICP